MWEWVLKSRISTHGLVVEPEFPRTSHISAYAAHQGGLVLRYGLERPVIIRIEIFWVGSII